MHEIPRLDTRLDHVFRGGMGYVSYEWVLEVDRLIWKDELPRGNTEAQVITPARPPHSMTLTAVLLLLSSSRVMARLLAS